jgi:probable F420-dependent oxidoreductase
VRGREDDGGDRREAGGGGAGEAGRRSRHGRIIGRLARMRSFRFSFNLRGLSSRADVLTLCRTGEAAGYDTVFVPDHLGGAAPFPLAVAAAEATSMRVGTLVLNAAFWNPALLAREVACVDLLTEGRLELGLGSGHMKWEFDEAGIGFESFDARADRLESMVRELRRFFTTPFARLPEGVTAPVPMQRVGFGGSGPPLIIGGTGDRLLRIGAEHADVLGVAGVFQIPGRPPGTFRLATAAEADERVGYARRLAGARADAIEWHLLVQVVQVTPDRRAAAADLVAASGSGMTVDEALETPYLLLGTVAQIAEQLRAHRERYGFSYVTVHQGYLETFAPVVEALRG